MLTQLEERTLAKRLHKEGKLTFHEAIRALENTGLCWSEAYRLLNNKPEPAVKLPHTNRSIEDLLGY